jgi:uncharacterized protein YkwD
MSPVFRNGGEIYEEHARITVASYAVRHRNSIPTLKQTAGEKTMHTCAKQLSGHRPVRLVIIGICLLSCCAQLSCSDDNPAGPAAPYADIEAKVLQLINQHRASLSPAAGALAVNDAISAQARKHSEEMAAGTAPFNHDGFDARVSAISTVIKVAMAGENIAMNKGYDDPASQAVSGWLNSAPHRANIEGDFTHTGIGVAKTTDGAVYFTQIFVKAL